MHTVSSFEVVTFRDSGQMIITTNAIEALTHENESAVAVSIDGADLVAGGPTPFRLQALPLEAIEYCRTSGNIVFAEMSSDDVVRVANLTVRF